MSEGTGNMMLRMLGLDGLAAALTSQDFQQQAHQVIAAILETRIRCERIEFKLDALLDQLELQGGPHVIRRRIPITAASRSGSADDGAAGAGVAGAAVDGRAGAAADQDGGGVGGAAGNGGLPGHSPGRPVGLVGRSPEPSHVRLGAMAPSLPGSPPPTMPTGRWLEL